MNWPLIFDLFFELLYNGANSLSGYMLGAKVLGFPEPAAFLLAACFGAMGMVNHWRALRKGAPVLLLALGLGLTGCTTVQGDVARIVSNLSTFTTADLDRAILMAGKAADAEAPYRARCYATLKRHVPAGSTVGEALLPVGAVSAFEAFAEADQHARAGVGIPQEIRADCSVILLSAGEFAARMGLKFAPIPGGGAVGGLLK